MPCPNCPPERFQDLGPTPKQRRIPPIGEIVSNATAVTLIIAATVVGALALLAYLHVI